MESKKRSTKGMGIENTFDFDKALDMFKSNELQFAYSQNGAHSGFLHAEFKVVDMQTSYEICFSCDFNFDKTNNNKLCWSAKNENKPNVIPATKTQFYLLASTVWNKRKDVITNKIIDAINNGTVISQDKIMSGHNSIDIMVDKNPLLNINYGYTKSSFDMVVRSYKSKSEKVLNDYKVLLERPILLSNYTEEETFFSDFDKKKILEELKRWESQKRAIEPNKKAKTK